MVDGRLQIILTGRVVDGRLRIILTVIRHRIHQRREVVPVVPRIGTDLEGGGEEQRTPFCTDMCPDSACVSLSEADVKRKALCGSNLIFK